MNIIITIVFKVFITVTSTAIAIITFQIINSLGNANVVVSKSFRYKTKAKKRPWYTSNA